MVQLRSFARLVWVLGGVNVKRFIAETFLTLVQYHLPVRQLAGSSSEIPVAALDPVNNQCRLKTKQNQGARTHVGFHSRLFSHAVQYLYIFVREPFIKTFMNDAVTFTREPSQLRSEQKIMTSPQRKTDPLKNHSTAQTDSNDPWEGLSRIAPNYGFLFYGNTSSKLH